MVNQSPIKKIIRWVVTIAICLILSWRVYDGYRHIKLDILNYMLSALSSKDLLSIEADHTNPDMKMLLRFERYFQYVAGNVKPQEADAYAMLGFCHAKMGQDKQAMAFYQKSIAINPYVAWVHFNVGTIYLRQHDFEAARLSFAKVLAVPIEANLLSVRNSKVYLDIIRQAPALDMKQRLELTYAQAYYLSSLSSQLIATNAKVIPEAVLTLIAPRIF